MGFETLVRSAGGDPLALLERRNINARALQEDELPLALDALAGLYEDAAEQLDMEDFGLRLSALQDLSLYGPLALVVRHARTVGDALTALIRYFAYHTPGGHIVPDDEYAPGMLCVRYQLKLSDGVAHRQITEQSFAMAAKLWSVLAPLAAGQQTILLRQSPCLAVHTYRQYFHCDTLFNQPVDAILLPADALQLTLDQADARLGQAAEIFVSNILRRFPLDIGKQVESLITRQLAFGGVGIDQIAAQLGMQRRTLQRRLALQGLVYGDLLDSVRRELAAQYLAQSGLSLADISTGLGYQEQSSFIRACRRWFSATPRQLRRTLCGLSS